jgi:hypothetical protein
MECPFSVFRNSDGTQDIQVQSADIQVQSADNITKARPEAVIMTTSDKIVLGK